MLKCIIVSNPNTIHVFFLQALSTPPISMLKVSWEVKYNSMQCCSLKSLTCNFYSPPNFDNLFPFSIGYKNLVCHIISLVQEGCFGVNMMHDATLHAGK